MVREQLPRYFQIDSSDDFALLVRLGADCSGAVTVLPMDAEGIPGVRIDPEYNLMSDAEVAGYIKDLRKRPLFVDAVGELRLTLGVHHKEALPLHLHEFHSHSCRVSLVREE